MSGLLRTVLIMSISGGIVAVLLFALKPLMRNRLPKSVQYYLWFVVVAALLAPVSVFVKLPVQADNAAPVAIPSNVVQRYVITAEEELDRVAAIPQTPIANSDSPYMNEHKQAQSPISAVVSVVSIIYPFVVAAIFLYHIIAYAVFTRKIRRNNKKADVDCKIPVYLNAKANTPMLIGLIRPVIVLPDCEYTDAQLRAVLLHELTHYRRKDVLVKWLSVIACSVHWFNPIVWLVRREIDRACELACDEKVVHNLDADGKQNYGDTLIYVAADSKTPNAVLSTTMCEEKKALKERLCAIMENKKYTRMAIIISAVLIFAVGGAAIALGAGRAENREGSGRNISAEKAINLLSESVGTVDWLGSSDGKAMNLDDVRKLAAKGGDLLFNDLRKFIGGNASSSINRYLMVYYVEGGYRLIVSSEDGVSIGRASLENVWANFGSGIDIRYNDVDAFLLANPSQDVIMEEEAQNIAQTRLALELEPVSWYILGDLPEDTGDDSAFARSLLDSVNTINEPCWVLRLKGTAEWGGQYYAVGKKSGDMFIYDNGKWNSLTDEEPWRRIHLGTPVETVRALLGEPDVQTSGLWSEGYFIGENTNLSFMYRQNADGVGVVSLIRLNGEQIEPWQRDVEIIPANWTPSQPLGADNPVLDYAGQTIDDDGIIRTRVIFHGYFGLFVYDTREQVIIFSLDLASIGCDATQGDAFCEVAVSDTGDAVTLRPINSETMYVLQLMEDNIRLFETPFDNNYMTKFRTRVIDHAFPGHEDDFPYGNYSSEMVGFSTMMQAQDGIITEEDIYYYSGYLYFNDDTIGGIQYREDDMGFTIFKQ